jgi:nucleotide-binding universal stress UspA family protein|tara:strand:+ start:18098 stop:19030 length:933 start_codon:yes stop_codon:yes gene_type:complete
MQRFKNILSYVNLALDEHPALERGVRLARHNNARLTVMTVIEEHPAQAHTILRSLHVKDALETIEHEYRDQLNKLVQPVRDAGFAVDTVVAYGSTFIEIIRLTLKHRHDLVIKSVSSEGIFHRTFFGSTDMHLLRKCPTPLWLIKPEEPGTFRRILVPLDPTLEDGTKHDLGMNLLKLATSLAEMDGADLMIIHAWRAYEEEKIRTHMDQKHFAEYLHKWEQKSSRCVWNFVSVFGSDIKLDSIHLVQGEPGFVIPKFAKDHDVDLLVMGTLGRLSQQGLFIGDTAERILDRIESSVLAVKPTGFISPVH